METNLAGNSNLVVTRSDGESGYEVIAIIAGKKGKGKRIVKQLEKAIKEHFVADDVVIVDSRTITNQSSETFAVHIYNDGGDYYEDFKIEVVPTY